MLVRNILHSGKSVLCQRELVALMDCSVLSTWSCLVINTVALPLSALVIRLLVRNLGFLCFHSFGVS